MIMGRLRGLPVVGYNLKLLVVDDKSAGYAGEGCCVNYGWRVKQQKNVKFRHVLCCLLRKNL